MIGRVLSFLRENIRKVNPVALLKLAAGIVQLITAKTPEEKREAIRTIAAAVATLVK